MYYHQKNQYINIVSFFHAKSSCKDDVHIVLLGSIHTAIQKV